jgi:hypothetical protein
VTVRDGVLHDGGTSLLERLNSLHPLGRVVDHFRDVIEGSDGKTFVEIVWFHLLHRGSVFIVGGGFKDRIDTTTTTTFINFITLSGTHYR